MIRRFFPLPFFFLAGALFAQDPPVAVSSPSAPFSWRTETNTAFGAGESLLFVIKYGFISGGHASLEIISTETIHGRAAYHILSEARTNSALDVVFKVRDLNESWMDVESLCSHRYHQVMNEGRHRREVESRYDHPTGAFVCWRRSKRDESTRQGTIPPFVHDVLTSLYYLRTRPLTPGEDIVLDVNSGAETWRMSVKVKGIEKVEVPAGTFECYRVEPLIAGEGLFMQTGNLEVWLTTDARRTPVLMRSKVMVGAFTAELVERDEHRTAPRGLLP